VKNPTPSNRLFAFAALICAASMVLSACGAAPARSPSSRQDSRAEAPKAAERAPARPVEVVKEVERRPALAPTEAPRAVAPANESNVVPAAPNANGPRPVAVDQSRMPVQPTSVAEPLPPTDATFKDYGVNPPIDPLRDRLSTFALDVDSASYAIARKYVKEGILPPYEAIRAEEFVNYFAQDYTPPTSGGFAVYADGAPSPFRANSTMLRVGIQGYRVPESQRKPAALTFVIDVSGSMNRENRLGLVKRSLELLVSRLDRSDSVSIVVYGDSARVHLPPTNGGDKSRILDAIYQLRPEGSTNTEAGMRLAYQMAAESYIRDGINRVILCSDGVANVGNTDPVSLINSVRGQAPEDVALTTIGFGMDNFNDVLMEQMANKGNGFYAYIDDIEEARTMFLDRLTNSLQVIARDAKVQVDFNPDVVASYRLIGYENRAVADQDFRNNAVDAGELNSGHNSTAIYDVQLRPGARGQIARVFLRWQDADTREIREIAGDVNSWDIAGSFAQASPRYRMNVVVAEYAEILRRSPYANTSWRQLRAEADALTRELGNDPDVAEFANLVNAASRMGGE
jgi:Ca-activated chloride channel homolog